MISTFSLYQWLDGYLMFSLYQYLMATVIYTFSLYQWLDGYLRFHYISGLMATVISTFSNVYHRLKPVADGYCDIYVFIYQYVISVAYCDISVA